jgi:putative transcriptional regulator
MTKGTDFGAGLIEGLKEAVAWKRGEITLPVRNAPSITADQVKAIRKAVAKSSKEFSSRFGIPLRTLEGWEQGRRRPDPAASILLRVIEKNPQAVEEIVAHEEASA